MTQSLTPAHGASANIVSLTCDGAPSNFAMLRHLGCDFNKTDSLKATFLHPTTQEPVVAILDACHMVKLVRNALCDRKAFVNAAGEEIAWHFIERLHDVRVREGLHLANHLRTAHIQWNQQTMKVSLAAQVLSMSVADSFTECRTQHVEGFRGSLATEQFLRIINDLFDISNSRRIHQKGWKEPMCAHNISMVENFFKEADSYLSSLKESATRCPVLHTNWKSGFLGFKVIKSLLELYRSLVVEKKVLKYIPTQKVSQDHLELLGH